MKLADLCPLPLPDEPRLPEEVLLGPGARAGLGAQVDARLGERPFRFGDPDTWRAADLGRPDWLLPRHPHADEQTAEQVARKAEGASGLVAVGSGTINDLAKCAAELLGIDFVVVGTAASMNGYASAIAAIVAGGLKTTRAARPARAIVLDTELLAAAPAALTRAGLGDLISKPVSDTDWWLADRLEGTGYSTLPGDIVERAYRRATAAAGGLMAGSPEAYMALGEALVLSGVAMVVAGSSAPASGGEHLLSHLWDMEALAEGREVRLHGAQVGVTTCISAAIYQRLIRIRQADLVPCKPWIEEERRLYAEHGALAPTLIEQARRKHARTEARLAKLSDGWKELRDEMGERRLPTPAELRAPLLACGAPASLRDLGSSRADGARVLRLARDIRDRLTVL
ncbi:MAG: iron-containing alcohol dehydrogenase, partial [Myxococcales bacterium]|nr:iron-containing alcohol dehydrogenase [Myxococcales bacterium]